MNDETMSVSDTSVPHTNDGPKVMWSPAQIAERDGITKEAVLKAVRKLVKAHDFPVGRDGRGRIARISLAHWDHYRGRFADPAKIGARKGKPAKAAARAVRDAPVSQGVSPGDSFEEAKRQNEWLKVDNQKMARAELAGNLVRKDKVDRGTESVILAIRARVGRLPNRADEIVAAAAVEGVSGSRRVMREIVFEMLASLESDFCEIAASAPEHDPLLVDGDRASPVADGAAG